MGHQVLVNRCPHSGRPGYCISYKPGWPLTPREAYWPHYHWESCWDGSSSDINRPCTTRFFGPGSDSIPGKYRAGHGHDRRAARAIARGRPANVAPRNATRACSVANGMRPARCRAANSARRHGVVAGGRRPGVDGRRATLGCPCRDAARRWIATRRLAATEATTRWLAAFSKRVSCEPRRDTAGLIKPCGARVGGLTQHFVTYSHGNHTPKEPMR